MSVSINGTNGLTFGDATTQNTGGYTGFRNRIINGDMRIAQRATSASTQGYVTVDRFYLNRYGGASGATFSQVSGAFGSKKYSLRLQRDAGNTSTASMFAYQAIEGLNSKDLAGSNVVVSFLVGCGANVTTSGHNIVVYYQTSGSDIGPTGSWSVAGTVPFTVVAGSSFNQKSGVFAVPSTATQIEVAIEFAVSGTAGVDDSFYLTEVQLEKGSVATPFEFRPYSTELALCLRYCEVYVNGNQGGIPQYLSSVDVVNRPETSLIYTRKRTSPSITLLNTNYTWLSAAATYPPVTSYLGTLTGTSETGAVLFFQVASGVTVNTLSAVGTIEASGDGKIIIDAELA